MADSPRRRRYSPTPSTRRNRSRSRSWSPARSRSKSRSRSPVRSPGGRNKSHNPGNNLFVTGLSTRITERELEEYFAREGKVLECRLVVDPRSKASRGFGFVTMDTVENADRCIEYLHRSILDGRVITVEKARRKRARTPTPGTYLGVRSAREISYGDRNRGRGTYGSSQDAFRSRRSPRYSPYHRRDHSPDSPPNRGRAYKRDGSASPAHSPYHSPKRGRAYRSGSASRSRSRSVSPYTR